jgi:hypothetical protein
MRFSEAERCLVLLRRADDILMEQNELTLACHLSLVIELLSKRARLTHATADPR